MELKDLFAAAIANIDETKITDALTATMEKTIIENIESTFRWGEAGKEIKKKLEDVGVNLVKNMPIDLYFAGISEFAARELGGNIQAAAKEQLKSTIAILTDKAPEAIKLSQLVEAAKKECYSPEWAEISLDVEEVDEYINITIKDEEKVDVLLTTWIWRHTDNYAAHAAGLPITTKVMRGLTDKTMIESRHGELHKMLYWLHSCGTKLELNENECDCEYSTED